MSDPYAGWLTAQATSFILDLTSAEVCGLLVTGRLNGIKIKQPGRAGKAQWLVDPKSIAKEKRLRARELAKARRRAANQPQPRP